MPALVIGIGPKTGGGSRSMPPPPDDDDAPGMPPDKEPDDDEGGKMSPAKALVSHENENCGNCANYHGEDGSCEEVSGQFDPQDRCWAAYSPAGAKPSEDGTMPPPSDDNEPANAQ